MNEKMYRQTADSMKHAGGICAIAAGGFNGMADAVAAGSPSAAHLADLREHGRKVIDAAPIAAEQLRNAAAAMERLGNLLWAALRDADKSQPQDGEEG